MSNVFLGAGCPRGRLNYVINMTESVQYRIFDTTSTCFAIFRRNPLHLDWNLHDCDVLFKVSHFWVCSRWATSSFVQGEPLLVLFKVSHFWFCSSWAIFGFVQGEPLLVLFKVSHFWFPRGENNSATHRPYQTSNIYHKIKSRRALLTHFDPSI